MEIYAILTMLLYRYNAYDKLKWPGAFPDTHKAYEICKEGEQLENYTKYMLKAEDELAPVIAGTDNLFIIACNKCFKEFETLQEPDCEAFEKIVAQQGKTVTGTAKVDFL